MLTLLLPTSLLMKALRNLKMTENELRMALLVLGESYTAQVIYFFLHKWYFFFQGCTHYLWLSVQQIRYFWF